MRKKGINVRMTAAEMDKVAADAADKKLTKSNYVRQALGLEIKRPKMIPNPEIKKPY